MWNKFKHWLQCQPFKRKLQWVIMTVVLTTVASTLGFLYWQKNQQQRADFVRSNLALAKLVAEFTVLPLIFDDSKGAEEQLSKLWKDPSIVYVLLEKNNGQILTYFDPSNIATTVPSLPNKQEWLWQDHRLYFAVPISHEHQVLGVLRGAYRVDELNQAQYRELHFMLLVMLIAALSSYSLALMLRGFVMAPIKQLEHHARHIAEQTDISESIIYWVHQPDEISRLYDAFNLLMSRIQQRESEILQFNHDLEVKIKERTQELQTAVQIKSAFLANMSHEIRTPMNAVIGMTYLVLQTDLTEKQRNYLNKINISANFLLGILNDILDFSKLEAGHLKLEHIEFKLESVMHLLNDVMSPQLNGKPLTLNFEVDPDVPTILMGDSLRLGQVLLNLLSNAIKFTEQGAVIVRTQLLSSNATQACLRFSVIDSGIGLGEEQQDLLFNAFTQADNSTTRKYGGTGLGLSISKQLIEAMGGNISVESRLGIGSSFYFTVTFDLASKNTPKLLPLRPLIVDKYPVLKNVYVLLVEDNRFNQELVVDMLECENIRVDIANNGKEAVAMIVRKDYSAVLMDCQMPIMDGFEATRIIRTIPRFADLPIIAITGNSMADDRKQCLDCGMSDYIAKPFRLDELLQILAHWIKKSA